MNGTNVLTNTSAFYKMINIVDKFMHVGDTYI